MESIELVREYIEAKNDFPIRAKLTELQKLSGGVVNYVYRLIFDDNSTLIFKYYPGFLAYDKTVKYSQQRYFVEKKALELLNNFNLSLVSAIRVPRLIYADDDSFILIMEDAGENSKPLLDLLKVSNGKIADELINKIAEEIFVFSNFLTNKSNIKPATHSDPFENKPAWEALNNFTKNNYKSQAILFGIEKELEPYIKEANENTQGEVFVYGDLWPNSILIDLEKNLVWIIDWEMARFETPTTDLDQFMTNLWIMKQNPALFQSDAIDKLIQRLQFEFFGDQKSDWRTNKMSKSNFLLCVVMLIKFKHWQLEDLKQTAHKALNEVKSLPC